MTIEIDLWQLIGFGISLLGGFAAILVSAGKSLLGQFQRRIGEQFKDLQEAHLQEKKNLHRLERDLLQLKADLPLEYVRREDYVRGQSIVEAKLDGLATKIDNVQLRAMLNPSPGN